MTSMRSELARFEMNKLFQSRKELNLRIRKTLEETCHTWGITCDRYEILKIDPPVEVRKSMQLQAEAERVRRKDIILSEAKKMSAISIAEGRKQAEILKAEGQAEGQAEALEIKALKEKEGLQIIAQTIISSRKSGIRALDYILKRKYYDEYANITKNASVTVFPESEPESENNSDILGAVSIMLNGMKPPKGNSSIHNNTSFKEKENPKENADKLENRSVRTKGSENHKQTAVKQAEKPESKIDWNTVALFNNPTVDK